MRGIDPKPGEDLAFGYGYAVGVLGLLIAGIGRVIFG